jgi:hypothetical protein
MFNIARSPRCESVVAGASAARRVPKGREQHGRVPVPMTVAFGGVDEPLDFGLRQVLAAAQFGVRSPSRWHRLHCSVCGGWGYQL